MSFVEQKYVQYYDTITYELTNIFADNIDIKRLLTRIYTIILGRRVHVGKMFNDNFLWILRFYDKKYKQYGKACQTGIKLIKLVLMIPSNSQHSTIRQ